MHLTTNPIAWYAARGAGVAAYVLLSGVITFGLLLAGRARLPRPRAAVVDVHRFGGLLIATFIVVHVVAIGIDSWLPFSIVDLLVPFVAKLRPLWMGLGIVAAELMLALGITNALVRRRRLPYRIWRYLHYVNWAVWIVATAHVVGTGTDRSAPWLVATVAVCCAAVAGAAGWRVMRTRPAWHIVAPVTAVAVAVIAVLAALGPLRTHDRPWNAASFTDTLSARILRDGAGNRGLVSLAGDAKGRQQVFVRVDLLASPEGVASTSLQVEYLPSGDRCVGEVTKIADDGHGFSGWCKLAGAEREKRLIAGHWGDSTSDTLTGVLTSKESPEGA